MTASDGMTGAEERTRSGFWSQWRSPKASSTLCEQFFNSLSAIALQIEEADATAKNSPPMTKAREILENPTQDWLAAYKVEQYFAQAMPPVMVEVELDRRMSDARRVDLKAADAYAAQIADARQKSDTGQLRAILLRLIGDVQWKFLQRHLRRRYSSVYKSRMTGVFVFSALILLAGIFTTLLSAGRLSETDWVLYTGLVATCSAGTFGAAFSQLVHMRKRISESTLDDIRVAYRYETILTRVLVGYGGALILYFLLRSDILIGTIWPDLTKLGFNEIVVDKGIALGNMVPNRDLCLLMVWSFIAGFSENFVPAMLTRTEARAGAKPKDS